MECLPHETRVAMLEGIRSSSIIVGAYTDRHGGVCPMLAAHRRGGRTNFASFAHAWDRYTGAKNRARQATERELRTLTTMLEASLYGTDLDEAIAEFKTAKERTGEAPTRRRRRDTGERDRTRELRWRPGWAWLRPFRRYDDYESAVRRAREEHAEASRDAERDVEHV